MVAIDVHTGEPGIDLLDASPPTSVLESDPEYAPCAHDPAAPSLSTYASRSREAFAASAGIACIPMLTRAGWPNGLRRLARIPDGLDGLTAP